VATNPLLVEDYGGYKWLYTTKYIADYHHNRESLSTHHYGMTEGFEHGSIELKSMATECPKLPFRFSACRKDWKQSDKKQRNRPNSISSVSCC
jgi:hypothetical protein